MNGTKYNGNITDYYEDDIGVIQTMVNDGDPWVILAVSVIGLVIFIGCTGNIMVLLAVRKVKKLQTVSNIFVMNLSVCDLLFVGCVLPFNVYTYLADGWFIATSLCKFVGFMGYTLTGTTIITITLIAYNRYKLILDPGAYKRLYTPRNIVIMLMVAWLVPVLCLVPALVGVWGKFGYVVMMVTCNLLLDHRSQFFKIFLMIVRAGIPCGLIVYYYARIYHATTTSHRKLNKTSSIISALDLHNQRKEMHMTRMMLMIFIVFAISYFPCTITGIVDWNTVLSKQFHMFCQISVYIGSAVNPLVYGLMNSQFRHAYLRMICCTRQTTTKETSTLVKDLKTSFLEANKICKSSLIIKTPMRNKSNQSMKENKYLNILQCTKGKPSSYSESSKDNSSDKSYEPLLQVAIVNEENSPRPKFTLE